MEKKQILFVVDEQMYGGICEVLKNIFSIMKRENYVIDLLILHNRGDGLKEIPKDIHVIEGSKFFKVIDLPIKTVLRSKNIRDIVNKVKLILYLKTGFIKHKIRKERKKFLSKQYDIEIGFKDGFCALFTACGNAKKKISWLHVDYATVDYTARYRKLFQEVYEKIDTVVAITEDVRDTFNAIYHVEEKTVLIENFIPVEKIRKKAQEQEISYEKDKLHLVVVGRVAYQKAYPRLIKQLGKLKQEENVLEDVRVHIVGDGDELDSVKQLVKEYKIEENIVFHGYQSNPYPYIKAADLLLLVSYYEGLGLTLYEALVLGVPAFATEFANVHQTLAEGKFGKIVPNSEEGIYHGLYEILKDRKEIDRLKQQVSTFDYQEGEKIRKKINTIILEEE